jgi:N-acetylmuramoyl-L-alanine amidase
LRLLLLVSRRRAAAALALLLLVLACGDAVRLRHAQAVAEDRQALRGRRVAIDPGHGGVDAGASGSGVRESDVVLGVAERLRDLLVAAGAEVLLTRDRGTDFSQYRSRHGMAGKMDVTTRMAMIEAFRPDVLVNVHANSFTAAPREHGAQVFFSRNGAEGSARLAALMQRELALQTGETRRKPNSGIDHYMLEHAPAPAVTVEVGFLSNPREARLLADPAYQAKLARAMADALAQWFAERSAGAH